MKMKTMNKLVKENIEDVLKPKSEEDIRDAIDGRIEEFKTMDERDVIESIADEFEIDVLSVAVDLLLNVDVRERNTAIEDVYRNYIEYGK